MSGRRHPPLHALRAFEAAARHGSMTLAAAELAVTPGAISRQVRGLEEELGTTLFLRRSTGIEATEAGAALAAELGQALDRIAEAAKGVKLRPSRRLSVGVYGFFAARVLLPLRARMAEELPGLELDLHSSTNPMDLVPARHDAVIAVSDAGGSAGLVTHRLVPIVTVPVCAPSLAPVEDFGAIHMLHARPRPDDWRRWLDHAGFRSVPAEGGSSFESAMLATEAAVRGLGVAIGIEALLTADLAAGTLAVAHPKRRVTRRWFVLQYLSRMDGDPEVARFAEWLVAVTAEMRGEGG